MVSDTLRVTVVYVMLFVAFFIRPFYKMMLGKKIRLNDMQCVVCGLESPVCSM